MKTSKNIHSINLNESDLNGILRLRTSVSRLCTKAFMAQRATLEGKKADPIVLGDVLELAQSFVLSLDDADHFWKEIDYFAKQSYSGQ